MTRILSRYLFQQIITVFVVVTAILFFVFFSNQCVRYLSYIAEGQFVSSVLFKLLLFEMPQLLSILLPLALFLAIVLAYGRMYMDYEMVALNTGGMGPFHSLKIAFFAALCVAGFTAFLTLWLSPRWLEDKITLLTKSSGSILSIVLPGRFQVSHDGHMVFYVETLSKKNHHVRHVFIAQKVSRPNHPSAESWNIFSAQGGYSYEDLKTNSHFILATDGFRYEGVPGRADYKIIHYGQYGMRLDEAPNLARHVVQAMSTMTLWQAVQKHHIPAMAEWQWRWSMPLSVLLLSMLAVAMSRIQPRQGQYARLFPALGVYIIYINLLFVSRAWIEEGLIAPQIGLWWVHLALLGFIAIRMRKIL